MFLRATRLPVFWKTTHERTFSLQLPHLLVCALARSNHHHAGEANITHLATTLTTTMTQSDEENDRMVKNSWTPEVRARAPSFSYTPRHEILCAFSFLFCNRLREKAKPVKKKRITRDDGFTAPRHARHGALPSRIDRRSFRSLRSSLRSLFFNRRMRCFASRSKSRADRGTGPQSQRR